MVLSAQPATNTFERECEAKPTGIYLEEDNGNIDDEDDDDDLPPPPTSPRTSFLVFLTALLVMSKGSLRSGNLDLEGNLLILDGYRIVHDLSGLFPDVLCCLQVLSAR